MKFEIAQLLLKLTENEPYTVACTHIVLLQKSSFDPRVQRHAHRLLPMCFNR
jgi:hypothetical protein